MESEYWMKRVVGEEQGVCRELEVGLVREMGGDCGMCGKRGVGGARVVGGKRGVGGVLVMGGEGNEWSVSSGWREEWVERGVGGEGSGRREGSGWRALSE